MISKKEKKFLESLINKVGQTKIKKENQYPLLEKGFTADDIMRGIEVLLSRKITMSDITKKFEHYFSKFVGSKYSLMVNSGSSANLLAAHALINPKKKRRLKAGDKFIYRVKNEKFYTPIIGETIYSVTYSDVNEIEILVNSGESY